MKIPQLCLPLLLLIVFTACDKKDDPKPDATNVTITGISIVTMPLTDPDGDSWDVDGGADPFFIILNSSTTLYSHPTAYQDVVSANFPLNYTIAGGYKLPYINQAYGINLYDYDATSANDFIGQVSFNPNNYKSERPASKTYTNGNIQVTVKFSWE